MKQNKCIHVGVFLGIHYFQVKELFVPDLTLKRTFADLFIYFFKYINIKPGHLDDTT